MVWCGDDVVCWCGVVSDTGGESPQKETPKNEPKEGPTEAHPVMWGTNKEKVAPRLAL